MDERCWRISHICPSFFAALDFLSRPSPSPYVQLKLQPAAGGVEPRTGHQQDRRTGGFVSCVDHCFNCGTMSKALDIHNFGNAHSRSPSRSYDPFLAAVRRRPLTRRRTWHTYVFLHGVCALQLGQPTDQPPTCLPPPPSPHTFYVQRRRRAAESIIGQTRCTSSYSRSYPQRGRRSFLQIAASRCLSCSTDGIE